MDGTKTKSKYACKECGSAERTTVLMSDDSPHYAKLICSWCGRFFWWVPRPKMSLEQLEIPSGPGDDADALPLVGTAKQLEWATSIRPSMLKKSARFLPPHVVAAMRTIEDASWWIANRNVQNTDDIKWPRTWKEKGTR